jgi:hypothetical protein
LIDQRIALAFERRGEIALELCIHETVAVNTAPYNHLCKEEGKSWKCYVRHDQQHASGSRSWSLQSRGYTSVGQPTLDLGAIFILYVDRA